MHQGFLGAPIVNQKSGQENVEIETSELEQEIEPLLVDRRKERISAIIWARIERLKGNWRLHCGTAYWDIVVLPLLRLSYGSVTRYIEEF